MPLPTKPVPAVPTWTDGAVMHQYDLNCLPANQTNLYAYNLGGFRTNKPLAAVRCTTQTIPNAVDTQVFWDTKDLDYDSMWSPSSTGQLTVNTAGIYRIYLQCSQSGPTAVIVCYICINGTSTQNNSVGTMAPSTGLTVAATATVGLAAGSVIYGFFYQATGSSQLVLTTSGGTRLTAEWLGPQ